MSTTCLCMTKLEPQQNFKINFTLKRYARKKYDTIDKQRIKWKQ